MNDDLKHTKLKQLMQLDTCIVTVIIFIYAIIEGYVTQTQFCLYNAFMGTRASEIIN